MLYPRNRPLVDNYPIGAQYDSLGSVSNSMVPRPCLIVSSPNYERTHLLFISPALVVEFRSLLKSSESLLPFVSMS
jgi:hypothetical protein